MWTGPSSPRRGALSHVDHVPSTRTFRTTRAINVVFGLLLVTFVLLGIGNAGGHETVIHWGGYIGLATAAAAAYTALAEVTNDTFDRSVLPLGKL